MKIYNTLTRKKETTTKQGKKNLFVCGPTVYDYSHIGHARTYLAFDVIVRYLRSRGWKIFYLQNITDIDDKIIARAKEENTTWKKIGEIFKKEYLRDMKALGIDSVDKYAPATNFIPEITRQIKTLIQKGCAYEIKGNGYYFDISKFSDYGRLSGRTVEQAEDAVSRIDTNAQKRNAGDFCLWKFSKTGEKPSWESEFGAGRPGWHIEDTAISEHYFGPQYDWHGGAEDLKFPHHEAEIAQQESASGKKPFVKIWFHTGFLLVNGKKMSKSLKNFITIKDFLKNNSPEVLRWLVLGHHYRSKMNFNGEALLQAKESLATLQEFLNKLNFVAERQLRKASPRGKKNTRKPRKFIVKQVIEKTEKEFHTAMEDDFNTPKAIAAIFNIVSEIQEQIWDFSDKDAKKVRKSIEELLGLLGLTLRPEKIPSKIGVLAKKREQFRVNQQFMQADALRDKIKGLGYKIEDTPIGPLVHKGQES